MLLLQKSIPERTLVVSKTLIGDEGLSNDLTAQLSSYTLCSQLQAEASQGGSTEGQSDETRPTLTPAVSRGARDCQVGPALNRLKGEEVITIRG